MQLTQQPQPESQTRSQSIPRDQVSCKSQGIHCHSPIGSSLVGRDPVDTVQDDSRLQPPLDHEVHEGYRKQLYSGVPLYGTRLVRLGNVPFGQRLGVRSKEDLAPLLSRYYQMHDREEVIVALLDSANTVIGLVQISIGGLDASVVDPRQIFKAALLANAAGVILAHNHPSGNPEPSEADIRMTRRLQRAGRVMSIPLLDHLIMTEGAYTSLKTRGVFD